MRRRIVVRESFDASFADLPDTPETAEVVSALVYAIVRDPERFPVLEETGLRGARSRSHDSYPALRR